MSVKKYRYDIKGKTGKDRLWSGSFLTLKDATKWYDDFGKKHEKKRGFKLQLIDYMVDEK